MYYGSCDASPRLCLLPPLLAAGPSWCPGRVQEAEPRSLVAVARGGTLLFDAIHDYEIKYYLRLRGTLGVSEETIEPRFRPQVKVMLPLGERFNPCFRRVRKCHQFFSNKRIGRHWTRTSDPQRVELVL